MSKNQKSLHNFFVITDKSGQKVEAPKPKEKPVEERKVDPNYKGVDLPPFEEFVDGLGSWKEILKPAWSDKSFKDLYDFLVAEYKVRPVYPPHDLIFNAFRLTPLNKVKVVILGQDPYHGPGQAMGLSFSVPHGKGVPSSLRNIYTSLATDPQITNFVKPRHGNLTSWARQGVFLLNTVLTVEANRPESHRKSGWDKFTDYVIQTINKNSENVVFMLWGAHAQKKAIGISESKHYVLKTSHPSGLSYEKGFNQAYHFSKCNAFLERRELGPIDWNLENNNTADLAAAEENEEFDEKAGFEECD